MSRVTDSRLAAYGMLGYFAVSRLGAFSDRLLRDELVRHIYASGISALPVLLVLAALAGVASVTQLQALVGQQRDLMQQLLFFGLFFELAPLLTGLVIVARSSAAIASELAVMRVHDEFVALRRMGVPAADYLLLPRIVAVAVAMPIASILFQSVAIGSGWLATTVFQNQPLLEVAGRFFDAASVDLALLALTKAVVTGLAIGVIAVSHGSSGDRFSHSISTAAMQAVGNGLIAVFLIDIAFALLLFVLK